MTLAEEDTWAVPGHRSGPWPAEAHCLAMAWGLHLSCLEERASNLLEVPKRVHLLICAPSPAVQAHC